MIHFKDTRHPRYPKTGCGLSIGVDFTDNIEKVTCKTCMASYIKFNMEVEIKERKGRVKSGKN